MNKNLKLLLILLLLFTFGVSLIVYGLKDIWLNEGQSLQGISIDSSPGPLASFEPILGVGKVLDGTSSASLSDKPNQAYKVLKVIDGDTIDVDIEGKKFTVRLIGVNTPETVDPRRSVQCFGVEASNKTKELLTDRQVILEKDVSETDKYGRILRYVFLPLENGDRLFVNDYLVREGYATAYDYPPDVKYSVRFRVAETEAREQNKGLWGKCQK